MFYQSSPIYILLYANIMQILCTGNAGLEIEFLAN